MKNSCQSTRELIVHFSGYIKGKTLDFGCGRAKYRDLIGKYASQYVTFDLFPGPNVAVVGDAAHTSFSNNEFDTVISTQVLEHVREPWLLIKEIKRVLKPKGICLLTVPFLVPYHPDPQDNFRFTSAGLASLFENEGFEILESGFYGGLFTVLSEFIHFSVFDPYRKPRVGSARIMNLIQKIANFLDQFVRNKKIYANVYVAAQKIL